MRGLTETEAEFLVVAAQPIDFDSPDGTPDDWANGAALCARGLVADTEAIDPRDGSVHDFWTITAIGRQVLFLYETSKVAA